jgi:catechol 2,3-dioxygenase-like lactoylglutathione lyase family enzyme
VFGLKEMYRDGPKVAFLRPPNSSDTITLNEVPDKAGTGGGIDHFGFRLIDKNQLDRAIEEVEQAGGHLIEQGENAPGRRFAYVADPDGHTIEL